MATSGLHTAPAWARTTDWQERAAIAERSVLERHLVRSFFLPFTATGMTVWPYCWRDRFTVKWNFWWQAHLIGCMTDAMDRAETAPNQRVLKRLARTHYRVNGRRWRHNKYYDDLAWAAVAVQRAERRGYLTGYEKVLRDVRRRFEDAYNPKYAIPWCTDKDYWNTPTNGAAAIFLARCGDKKAVQLAERICDWMYKNLQVKDGPNAGLYADGIRLVEGCKKREDAIYTYCQGVAMGAELELALRSEEGQQEEHLRRVCEIVEACERTLLSSEGILLAGGSGDGGLFKGILMRYMADVARRMPGIETDPGKPLWDGRLHAVQESAARMVMQNAQSLWKTAAWLPEGVLFSAKWDKPARLPLYVSKTSNDDNKSTKVGVEVDISAVAERDMSTQLSGWMTVESAARLVRMDCSFGY